jgi:hypothetical protein
LIVSSNFKTPAVRGRMTDLTRSIILSDKD